MQEATTALLSNLVLDENDKTDREMIKEELQVLTRTIKKNRLRHSTLVALGQTDQAEAIIAGVEVTVRVLDEFIEKYPWLMEKTEPKGI